METDTTKKAQPFANQQSADVQLSATDTVQAKSTYESLFLHSGKSATPEILEAHIIMLYKTLLS